jgi:alcohol dehydrogenase class IV
LPSSLCSMGITVDMIPDMAGHCMKDMCTTTNPTSMTYDLYVELFEKALVNE